MTPSFAGKKVLITGSEGLFGRELAAAFRVAGATLQLWDRVAVNSTGGPMSGGTNHLTKQSDQRVVIDLADASAVARQLDSIAEADLPDILINNAAIFPFVDLLDADPALCRQIMEVNVLAPLLLTQELAKRWMAQGQGGVVVNVSSASAEVARINGAIYGPSKAALEHVTRLLALRLGGSGIRVNAVRPGIADDPTNPQLPEAHLATIANAVPLGRTIAPGELARAVMFLCSEASSFTTGHVLSVDGGGGLNRRAALPTGST